MKKLLKLNAIFLLTFILLGVPSVLATEPPEIDPPIVSYGTFTHDGFEYTIRGVHLDVYESKIENNKFAGYKKDTLQTINIEGFSVETTWENVEEDNDEDFHEYNVSTVAQIKLNKTKEELLALVKEKYPTVDSDHHYYIRVVVDYTIEEVPDDYQYYYKLEYTNTDNSLSFFSSDPEASFKMVPIELNTEVSAVFNVFEYKLDTDNNEVFSYATHYTDGSDAYVDPLISGTTMFSSLDETKPYMIVGEGVTGTSGDPETQIVTEKYTRSITFTGYDNYEDYGNSALDQIFNNINGDELISSLADLLNEAISKEEDASQTVKVDNTAATYPIYIYVVSTIGIIVGSLILLAASMQNQQKQKTQQQQQ